MMAAIFAAGLLAYYAAFLRGRAGNSSELARLLWLIYFALGCMAILADLTGVIEPLFQPNYPAILFLTLCIIISISGFLGFRSRDVRDVVLNIRGQGLIEAVLLAMQGFSIAFFLPFALTSLSGDVGANRLELSDKAQLLGSYGLINTIAGMGSHLFMVSLVMAFIRVSQPEGAGYSLPRAILLVLASLSYVIYVLAYVGRDGSIYWLMTGLLLFVVFRSQISARVRKWIVLSGATLGSLVLLPIVVITVARFATSEAGLGTGFWEYFGAQINNFSDYSSIDRPITHGAMNFPVFWRNICPVVTDFTCANWEDMGPYIFDQYLTQGQAPWLFATFVSDFVADFDYAGTLAILVGFAFLCHRACVGRDGKGRMSPSRLMLIIFYFLTPYFGVFYFRFGIINSFLLVNLIFIGLVWLVQYFYPPTSRALAGARLLSSGNAGPSTIKAAPDRPA